MGTFHFASPGKDAVENQVIDVMTVDSQAYLEQLADSISKYNPTVVLLEYDQKEDRKINESYSKYRIDKYQLQTREADQIGFRVAKLCGLDRVYSFDETDTPWQAQKLFEQLKKEPHLEKQFHTSILRMTEDENRAHASLSLQDLLKRYNSPEMDLRNKSLYITTNAAGADENFAGADASASWWHRNFRMFARIQKFAVPGERILVIGGQGHTAVIRDFLKLDSNIKSEEVTPYL